ncbi:hemolysin III family protein [Breoghania sp.]|uniref:PAQR family membrane homeostasis protein TrhA n=1 Tax=Breoghania sp. TaxID=2065378 RepID=UPI003204F675
MTYDWAHIVSWHEDRLGRIADAVVHFIGLALAAGGAAVLLVHAFGVAELAAVCIYVVGLIAALTASSLYNIWPVSRAKWILRRFDHSAIFLFIAATYTPFLAQMPTGALTIALTVTVWELAVVGIILKLALPGRSNRIAVVNYLALGWCGVVVYPTLSAALPVSTLWLIGIGGGLYSFGVVFYAWE